jgi:Flp pilus assembly CpaE family ATPase
VLWGVTSDAQSRDVRAAVSRHTGIESIFVTPHDFDAMRKAVQANTFLSDLDSKNSITKEFEAIAKMIYQNLNLQSKTKLGNSKPKWNLLKRTA